MSLGNIFIPNCDGGIVHSLPYDEAFSTEEATHINGTINWTCLMGFMWFFSYNTMKVLLKDVYVLKKYCRIQVVVSPNEAERVFLVRFDKINHFFCADKCH